MVMMRRLATGSDDCGGVVFVTMTIIDLGRRRAQPRVVGVVDAARLLAVVVVLLRTPPMVADDDGRLARDCIEVVVVSLSE